MSGLFTFRGDRLCHTDEVTCLLAGSKGGYGYRLAALTTGNPQTLAVMAGRKAGDTPSGRRFAPGKALEGAGQGARILVAESIGDLRQREPPGAATGAPVPAPPAPRHWRKLHPSCWRKSRLRVRTRGAAICRQRPSVRWMAGAWHTLSSTRSRRGSSSRRGECAPRADRHAPAPGQAPPDRPLHLPSASSGRRAKRPASSGLACKGRRRCGRRRHIEEGEPGAAQHAKLVLPPRRNETEIWPATSSSPSPRPVMMPPPSQVAVLGPGAAVQRGKVPLAGRMDAGRT